MLDIFLKLGIKKVMKQTVTIEIADNTVLQLLWSLADESDKVHA